MSIYCQSSDVDEKPEKMSLLNIYKIFFKLTGFVFEIWSGQLQDDLTKMA